MKFKATTIAPAGRNEYGNYTSSGTVVRKMNQAMYYGDNSTGGNDGGGSTGGNNDDNKDDYTGFYVMLSKTTNSFDGQDVAISAVTDTTQVVGYRAMNRVQTYVMDLNSVTTTVVDDDTVTYTAPDNFGIKGLPSTGMTVSVSGNGTTGATISFKLESIVPTLKGEIQIPVCICKKATTEEFGDSLDNWMNYLDSIQIVWLTYAWELTTTSESSYTMDLTNDSATINADADGNVLTGATRPSCTATLFYGTLPATGVTYSFATNVAYTGLTIEPASGILNFEDDFNFTGSPLEITISATLSGKTEPSGKKVMTITKVFPGIDGDSVSRWLTTSVSAIRYNPNDSILNPTGVTAICWKQVNEEVPVVDTETTIYYGWDTSTPSETYTGAVAVIASKSYLAFGLKNTNGGYYELETIPILSDGENGKDGEKGADGRQGAAVRGPVEWTKNLSNRRWCNGEYSEAYPEDGNWIDIIYYNEKIYRCSTSYNGTASDTWDKVSSNWEEASEFNFVATNLLLAKNAYIEFLTNRGLYLRDSGNTITGGMQGGNGTNVWVGSDSPSTAPFKVDYDGTMTATKGKFGCLEVGSNDTYNYTYLKGSENDADGEKHFLNVNPLFLGLGGGYISGDTGAYPEESLENYREFVRISPYAADDIAGGNAAIMAMDNPFGSSSTVTMIQTNGVVEAYGGIRTKASGDAIKFELVSALPQTTDDNTLYFVY